MRPLGIPIGPVGMKIESIDLFWMDPFADSNGSLVPQPVQHRYCKIFDNFQILNEALQPLNQAAQV